MSVDWSKPLELADGRRVRLLKPKDVPGGANPDGDGDYWVLMPYGRKQCVRPDGRLNARSADQLVYNPEEKDEDE